MKEFYYVTRSNTKRPGVEILLGFNFTEEEKNNLFYSLGKKKNSAIGCKETFDAHLSNSYGCHSTKFKNKSEAKIALIDKPDAFNDALELLKTSGYDVVKKGIVHKNKCVVSYQMEKDL